MKALAKSRAEPGIWLEEVAVPTPGTNEVSIKIQKTGICGTDAHIYNWDDWARRNIQTPRVIGPGGRGSAALAASGIKVFELLTASSELRDRLHANTRYFREAMAAAGFDSKPGQHPIVPIILYDAVLARTMASKLLEQGIYVIGFSYPAVPKNRARIRVQISAAHTRDHLDRAVEAFAKVAKALQVL